MKLKYIIPVLLCSIIFVFKLSWGTITDDSEPRISFREVWGYLMRGEEKLFIKEAPISDVFYFSATINRKGRINKSVYPPFKPAFSGGKHRVHLVISDLDNPSRMHLCLQKKYGVRYYLLKDILEVSSRFDGIQIDFEAVENRDGYAFKTFLRDLKESLPPGKILSVAVPAKKGDTNDVYGYEMIAKIADRVLVMAYDQHWSTSRPGPVASLAWCRDVASYALKTIPREKLVIGLPLYGREWGGRGSSRAVKGNQANKLLERDDAVIEYSVDEGYKVMFDENMKSTFYCDDIKATRHKLNMYSTYDIGIGFWRLGMENENLWSMIAVSGGG